MKKQGIDFFQKSAILKIVLNFCLKKDSASHELTNMEQVIWLKKEF